jgi:hypothetical protein
MCIFRLRVWGAGFFIHYPNEVFRFVVNVPVNKDIAIVAELSQFALNMVG